MKKTDILFVVFFMIICTKTLFADSFKVFLNEGITSSQQTRIIYQVNRSNFVFKDLLLGLYIGADFSDLWFSPTTRLALYYPMGFVTPSASTFNDFPQGQAYPLHFGIDFSAGLKFYPLEFKYVSFNFGPALHFFYLTSDRWNYINLGILGFVGAEIPLAKKWTLLCNGYLSYDNGNIGSNRQIEPFDIVYQYQLDIGVRYSSKKRGVYED